MHPPEPRAMNQAGTSDDLFDILPDITGQPAPVLIVDDDPVVQMFMRAALEDDGFTVVEADDGLSACRQCADSVPSLLIVDAMMPNMDGFELCRVLRRQPETQHVPILMATGLEDKESICRAYEAGATDFIAKPINWPVLVQRVHYMLRGARTLDALRRNQQRLRATQKLEREQGERLAAALGNMSQGLCMFGADGLLIVSNQRFQDLFQLSLNAVEPGRSMAELLRTSPVFSSASDQDEDLALTGLLELAAQRTPGTLTRELASGRTINVSHEPMPGGGFVDTFTDVTEQRLAEARIAHMAMHDPLTDLPNRLLFRQRLEDALRRPARDERCAVLCLDLDQFKDVNDTLGHPVGDALLKAVTQRLCGLVRQTDTVARLGGDEFAIVQSRFDHSSESTALADRLLHELSQPFDVAGHHIVIGTSIGIAMAPDDGADPDTLLKSADIALYQAKSDGRNRFRYFEPAMDALMQARRELELDLRRAVAESEFELFYQAQVNLASKQVSGFEALLRWRHPRHGIVLPGKFIPLAEETGLIIQIGEWALHNACQHARWWPSPLKVAVNISAVQFRNRRLVEAVTRALRDSGLDPCRLELEVTESVMIQDFDAAMAMLYQLKALGVSISMDDFGTGYSSLSYLRSFPFDKIKIDQSFIRGLGKKSDCTAIIRAVTGMCGSLGITATAEGVETAEQYQLLCAENCTEIQGYFVTEPRPAHEVPAFLSGFAPGIQVDVVGRTDPGETVSAIQPR
ncbi:MAG TPA: EAL domain-containing protein [Acetobacteraceae bacterium]|nr:EAL domain-containing protein [Acetobacteraceae bacterium]